MQHRRIGIMGGTFDPIHIGHLLIAENALESYHLNEVLFIPTGVPYMKSEKQVSDVRDRVRMVELAISDNPNFSLSTIEADETENTYTYRTLEKLKELNSGAEYFFIMGADSLFAMESWRYPEKIFSDCTVLAAVRDEKNAMDVRDKITELEHNYKAKILLLPARSIEISSTDIRRRLMRKESVRYMVQDTVITYIKEQKLYETE